MAEDLAARFLSARGLTVLERNVTVGRGEIDMVVAHDNTRVAVEVRSRWMDDPVDAFDEAKHRQVWALAAQIGCGRVDLIAVRFDPVGVDIRWVPNVT